MSSSDLPLLIHTHHSQYLEDLPFWLGLAYRRGSPVLELGCGGGRVLLALAAEGIGVVGVDRDFEMLSILRETARDTKSLPAAYFQGTFSDFSLNWEFPLVIMPCNTLSTIPQGDRVDVFRQINRSLDSDGLFVASLPNPDTLAALPSFGTPALEDEFLHPTTRNPVQVSSGWSKDRGSIRIFWHYDHLLPDGEVERLTASTVHFLASRDQVANDLLEAGLLLLDVQGDYDGSPLTPDSPAMILYCARERL
jgi:SAM-dependent methyltransferase